MSRSPDNGDVFRFFVYGFVELVLQVRIPRIVNEIGETFAECIPRHFDLSDFIISVVKVPNGRDEVFF